MKNYDINRTAINKAYHILGNTQRALLINNGLSMNVGINEADKAWKGFRVSNEFKDMDPEMAQQVLSFVRGIGYIASMREHNMYPMQAETGIYLTTSPYYYKDKELNRTCNYILDNNGVEKRELIDGVIFGKFNTAVMPFEFQSDRCVQYEVTKLITQTYCYPSERLDREDAIKLNSCAWEYGKDRKEELGELIKGYMNSAPNILGETANEISELTDSTPYVYVNDDYQREALKNTHEIENKFINELDTCADVRYLPYECYQGPHISLLVDSMKGMICDLPPEA